jgi:hypothetical protein
MSKTSDGAKQNTKKLCFTLLSAFFNFIKNSLDPQFNNPCDNPQLRKLCRAGKAVPLKILEKDVVDAHHLKSCQKFYYVIRIFRPLSDIWEKSVMRKLYVGSTIFTDNETMTGQGISFSPVISQNLVSISVQNYIGILDKIYS